MRADSIVNRSRKDGEGFMAHRRWKGREFSRPFAELEERTRRLPATSAGEGKFDVRRKEGAWLGIRMESGESIVGAHVGVVKARDFRRKPENEGRRSEEDFDNFVSVLWGLCSGAGGRAELKSKVRLPIEPGELARPVKGKDEHVT